MGNSVGIPYCKKALLGRIQKQRQGGCRLKRPAAGGELCKQDFLGGALLVVFGKIVENMKKT